MLVETMAADFKKENKRCFTCRNKNHLKRDCPKRLIKNLQKCALVAIKKYIGPRIINLNLILMKNLFQKIPNRGPPLPTSGPLPQKPETNFIISLKPSTSDSAAVDIPALNDFFLYPQTVPSRVPTRLFGPLPPQTFSLLLGPSSLTSKKITVHPEIIDSDYKTKIQIMMSSQIL